MCFSSNLIKNSVQPEPLVLLSSPVLKLSKFPTPEEVCTVPVEPRGIVSKETLPLSESCHGLVLFFYL